MIDVHIHILPGLDDGPRNMEDSLAMARQAVTDGIRAVVATPHVAPGLYNNSKSRILDATKEFREQLKANVIPLEVYAGAEYLLDPDLSRLLKAGEALTIGDGGIYLLVELPFTGIPLYARETLSKIVMQGITPIIAHPERSQVFLEEPERLLPLLEFALGQCTSGSLTGLFGRRVQQVAAQYLKKGCYHFIGTDAHGTGRRNPVLSEGRDAAEKLRPGTGKLLTATNPVRILKGLTPLAPWAIQVEDSGQAEGFWGKLRQLAKTRRK